MKPQDFGIEHGEFRDGQVNAYLKAASMFSDSCEIKNLVIEAGTGFGKSVIPTMLGRDHNTLVLVQSLGLLDQYEREYGFVSIKGKSSYPCVFENKVKKWSALYSRLPMASDCHLKKMTDCQFAGQCPYLVKKKLALESRKMACTYKYGALSNDIHDREGVVVFDEAHSAPTEILDVSDFAVYTDTLNKMKLLELPLESYGKDGSGDIITEETRSLLKLWFAVNIELLEDRYDPYDPYSFEMSRNRSMVYYMKTGKEFVSTDMDVYLYCGQEKNKHSKGFQKMLKLKPMESSYGVNKIIKNKSVRVFMSATIGNPRSMAREMGLGRYEFVTYPHPTPKEKRPVYDLGIPKMTYANLKKNPGLYNTQANKIIKFIKELPSDWRGIVLTTSFKRIELLRSKLKLAFMDRVLVPENSASSSERILQFINSEQSGAIAVDTIQGWGHGLDFKNDIARFVVVAGVPYENPTDKYSQLRMSRDGGKAYSYHLAHLSVPQSCGRVSRGEKNENGEYVLNVAALADGCATSPYARISYPKYFREAIVEYEKEKARR